MLKKQAPSTRLWLQILSVALVAVVGVSQYQLQARQRAVGGAVALQRLDLLYLHQPAPGLAQLGVTSGSKTVVVFCQKCRLPEVAGTRVVGSSDISLADSYALVTSSGRLGPGYVIIDSHGSLRYRSFDADPASHSAEINRLVKGVE